MSLNRPNCDVDSNPRVNYFQYKSLWRVSAVSRTPSLTPSVVFAHSTKINSIHKQSDDRLADALSRTIERTQLPQPFLRVIEWFRSGCAIHFTRSVRVSQ